VVAPLADAWIETIILCDNEVDRDMSHPSRVRGLKHGGVANDQHTGRSHPSRVRGLKRVAGGFQPGCSPSHPSRVRGLKRGYEAA